MSSIQEQEGRARRRVAEKQAQAIAHQSRIGGRVGTIGASQPNGRYVVNLPDGGKGQGVKIYNSRHDEGDSVLLTDRGDGNYLLDGPKAPPPPKELNIPSLKDRCQGYLNGQIFHCGSQAQETVIAWAIGKQNNDFYYLLNLVSGESYTIGSGPATIRPCLPGQPSGTPPEPPLIDGEDVWYLHVWITGNFTMPASRCVNTPPYHPNAIGNTSEFDLTILGDDGRIWSNRFASGQEDSLGFPRSWNSSAISVRTQSPTPPPVPQGPQLILYNAIGFVAYSGGSIAVDLPGMVYASGNCAASQAPAPIAPPRDQNPATPPIPNTIEYSLSIGPTNNPIAYLRHSPSCTLLGRWDFDQSAQVVAGLLKTAGGKLAQDWRYGPTFTCRDTFSAEHWINVDAVGKVKLWSIESNDRPTVMTPGTPFQLKVTEKSIAANCSTTVVSAKTVATQVTGNLPITIVAIAVKIIKR